MRNSCKSLNEVSDLLINDLEVWYGLKKISYREIFGRCSPTIFEIIVITIDKVENIVYF